jgi:hypothetical protein
MQGKVELAEALRHDGAGEWRGENWRERVVGKAAGDERVFIPGRGFGQVDEASSDAIPDAAGGEGGHGAAKPHGVIHGCIFNHCRFRSATGSFKSS